MKTNTDDKDEVISGSSADGAESVEYLGGSKNDDAFWLTLAQST